MIQIDKEEITEWGKIQYYNSSEDTFRFAIYEYNDEPEVIYLSNVFVSPESRHVGFGNTILKLVDKIAKNKGTQVIFLKVKKSSFAYNWYNRHGYKKFGVDKEDNTMIWMKKEVNMTQEDKDLLLKDLCARLPYGVKVKNVKNNFDINTFNHNIEEIKFLIEEYNIKPYLRPMSSMTEEERIEFSVFIGKTETYVQQICLDADSIANSIIGGSKCVYWGLFDKCIDWLNSHHFDYRGLIDKGLALEAPEGVY